MPKYHATLYVVHACATSVKASVSILCGSLHFYGDNTDAECLGYLDYWVQSCMAGRQRWVKGYPDQANNKAGPSIPSEVPCLPTPTQASPSACQESASPESGHYTHTGKFCTYCELKIRKTSITHKHRTYA